MDFPRYQQLVQLQNQSNDCFANAGFNFLLSSVYFSHFIAKLPNVDPTNLPIEDLLFQHLEDVAHKGSNNLHNLNNLRNTLGNMMPEAAKFRNGTQEDASEWIIILLQAIENVLERYGHNLSIFFRSKFSLGLDVTYKCKDMDHENIGVYQEEMILQLTVVHSNTLPNIIEYYFKPELVEKRCQNCSCKYATKYLHISKSPEVLIIQYLRFLQAGNMKNTNQINADIDLNFNGIQYKLTGILIHLGATMNSGHYICITRCWTSGKFYKMDDDRRSEVLAEEIPGKIKDAYMLMYCKQSVRPQDLPTPSYVGATTYQGHVSSHEEEELASATYVPIHTGATSEDQVNII